MTTVAIPPSHPASSSDKSHAAADAPDSPSDTLDSVPVDADGSLVPAHGANDITPLQSSVRTIGSKLRDSQRLQSTLQSLKSYLPAAIQGQAEKRTEQIQALSQLYALPLAVRVDSSLNNAYQYVLSAPATAQAKVAAAEAYALSYAPESIKPRYAATRETALRVVDNARQRVVHLKQTRGEPLWERLSSSLDGLQVRIIDLKSALSDARLRASEVPSKASAAASAAAQRTTERIVELQAQISTALQAAKAKGAQARALSQDILHNVGELGLSLTAYVESNLSEQQQATVRLLWSKLLDGVSTLQETLHIKSSPAGSPSDSASISAVSSVAGSAAAGSPVSSRSNSTTSSIGIDDVDAESKATEGVHSSSDDGAHILHEADDHSATNSQHATPNRNKKKQHKNKHKQREEAEAKAKEHAENH